MSKLGSVLVTGDRKEDYEPTEVVPCFLIKNKRLHLFLSAFLAQCLALITHPHHVNEFHHSA